MDSMQSPSLPDKPQAQPSALKGYGLFGALALGLHLLLLWLVKPSLPVVPAPPSGHPISAQLIFTPPKPQAQSSDAGQDPNAVVKKDHTSETVLPAAGSNQSSGAQSAAPGQQPAASRSGTLPADPFARQEGGGQDFGQQLESSLKRLQQQRQQQWLDSAKPGADALPRPKVKKNEPQIIELGGGQRLYRGPHGECALLQEVDVVGGKETRWLSSNLCQDKGPDFQSFIKKRQHQG